MKSSCIRHPENTRFIQLHDWQIKFCKGNHCAALLLSYFSAWHDWKIRHDQYYRQSNDIAEMHGDGRPNIEDAFLFFTTEKLIDGCMGLYRKKAICEGLELLKALGVISVHKNPNPRYHFDKTKYFKFYPQICNQWITQNYLIKQIESVNHTQAIDSYDRVKIAERKDQNVTALNKNVLPSSENDQAITNTTNNTTNKNQSINSRDDLFESEKPQVQVLDDSSKDAIQPIVDALIEKGMPANKFYPDVLSSLTELFLAGASVEHFIQGYDIAGQVTNGQFGMNYVIKTVASLLEKTKKQTRPELFLVKNKSTATTTTPEYTYENDFKHAQSWAGDLL